MRLLWTLGLQESENEEEGGEGDKGERKRKKGHRWKDPKAVTCIKAVNLLSPNHVVVIHGVESRRRNCGQLRTCNGTKSRTERKQEKNLTDQNRCSKSLISRPNFTSSCTRRSPCDLPNHLSDTLLSKRNIFPHMSPRTSSSSCSRSSKSHTAAMVPAATISYRARAHLQ